MFVAQLDDARLVLASLLFTNQLATMTSTANAPPVVANVVGKGFNFSLTNVSGNGAGPGIPQPGLPNKLSSGDTGGARTYGAVRSRGTVYVTRSEFWGEGTSRIPAIYWAYFTIGNSDLCTSDLALPQAGLVSSQDNLALAFPVIGARDDGGAVLAFSYGGAGGLPGGGQAYAGVATAPLTLQGSDVAATFINIVRRGTAGLPTRDTNTSTLEAFGSYSAGVFAANRLWFAVATAVLRNGSTDVNSGTYGSVIGSVPVI